MGKEESKKESQAEKPSKVKNTVMLIMKIIVGLGFLYFIYSAVANKFGW